jgi:hypothetical protein
MNIKVINHPVEQIRNAVKNLVEKLTQNPEFYNIKYYTKTRGRYRNQKKSW